MHTEQRQNPRYASSKDFDASSVQAYCSTGTQTPLRPVSIIDISFDGVQIRLPLVDANNPKALQQVALAFENGDNIQLGVTPIHRKRTSDGYQVGLRFNQLPENLLRNLSRLFAQTTPISHRPPLSQIKTFGTEPRPDKILNFLNKHINLQSTFVLYPDLHSKAIGKILLQSLDTALPDFPVQGIYRTSTPLPSIPGTSYTLALFQSDTVYFFSTRLRPSHDPTQPHAISLALPERITRGGTRSTTRTTVPPAQELYIEFIHPHRPNTLLHKPIQELSTHGLSFSIDLSEDTFCVGQRIHAVKLRLPNAESVSCSMTIQNIHPIEGTSLHHCGVALTNFVGTTRKNWLQRVLSFLAPDVRPATPWDIDTVWNVYDESGYLEEKERSLLEEQRDSFTETWSHLARSPDNARIFLFDDHGHGQTPGKTIATIATSRIYSHTWVIHQLAAMIDQYSQPHNKLDVFYQLIPRSLFPWFLGLQADACVIGTIDATRRLNQWIWEQFKRYTDGLHSQVQDLDFYSFSLRKLPTTLPPQTLDISPPTEAELLAISNDLLDNDGPLAHHVFDYSAEKLHLSFWNHVHEAFLIGHQRHIWVARIHGQMQGYCLVESAKPGVNIFSIYNTMRILVRETDPQLAQDIRNQLFAQAIQYYRQHGIDSMIYAAGPKETPPPSSNYVSKNQALRLVARSEHFPLIISYLADHWH